MNRYIVLLGILLGSVVVSVPAAEVVTEPAAEPPCIPCGWDREEGAAGGIQERTEPSTVSGTLLSQEEESDTKPVAPIVTEPPDEPECIPCGWR